MTYHAAGTATGDAMLALMRERDRLRNELSDARAEAEGLVAERDHYREALARARSHEGTCDNCGAHYLAPPPEQQYLDRIAELERDRDEAWRTASAHAQDADEAREQLAAAQAEVERLRGLRPKFPPFPSEGGGLPRYGLRWNGPTEPISVPMQDGYWTPWHLADALRARAATLEEALRFYADETNWDKRLYDVGASGVAAECIGPACDDGERAHAALSPTPTPSAEE